MRRAECGGEVPDGVERCACGSNVGRPAFEERAAAEAGPRGNRLAVWSVALGPVWVLVLLMLVALGFASVARVALFGLPAALVVGLALAIAARRQMRRDGTRGPAVTGIWVSAALLVLCGLLAAGMVKMGRIIETVKRADAMQDIAVLEEAVGRYAADNGRPPTTEQGLEALITKPTAPPVPKKWRGPYLDTKRPPKDPWGREYAYEVRGHEYAVMSYGPDGRPGGKGWNENVTRLEEER